MKLEIVKAEYGAGATQKDVTETLQKHVGDLPLDYLAVGQLQRGFRRRPGAGHAEAIESPVPDQRQGGRGLVRRERLDRAADAEVSLANRAGSFSVLPRRRAFGPQYGQQMIEAAWG